MTSNTLRNQIDLIDKASVPSKNILPEGAYIIGDPCYLLQNPNETSDRFWKELVTSCSFWTDRVEGIHTIKDYDGTDHSCALFDTGGDGGFEDLEGMFEYGVDSGSLGAFPITFRIPPCDLTIIHGMRWCNQVYFENPFYVGRKNDLISFGDVFIQVYDQ